MYPSLNYSIKIGFIVYCRSISVDFFSYVYNINLFRNNILIFMYFQIGPRKIEDYMKKIDRIMGIGCDKDQALVALSSCNWDMDKAIEQIFG